MRGVAEPSRKGVEQAEFVEAEIELEAVRGLQVGKHRAPLRDVLETHAFEGVRWEDDVGRRTVVGDDVERGKGREVNRVVWVEDMRAFDSGDERDGPFVLGGVVTEHPNVDDD